MFELKEFVSLEVTYENDIFFKVENLPVILPPFEAKWVYEEPREFDKILHEILCQERTLH